MPLVKAYITHKRAEQHKDCQDSFCISKDNKSIAIADGVSQSIFPKIWADMLTQEYVNNPKFTLSDMEKIAELRSSWKQFFQNELERQRRENTPLLWKLEDCYNEGKSAGATFVGIRFIDKKNIKYEVLGDSCIVIVKEKKIQEVISSKDIGSTFDNYPDYIDSNVKIGTKGKIKKGHIIFEKGMEILLVTDALSEILSTASLSEEKGENTFNKLSEIANSEQFEACIESFRDNGMSNDDTTMIYISWTDHDRLIVVDETDINNLIALENDTKSESENSSSTTAENKTTNTCKKTYLRLLIDLFGKQESLGVEDEDKYVDTLIEKNLPKAKKIIKDYLFSNKTH